MSKPLLEPSAESCTDTRGSEQHFSQKCTPWRLGVHGPGVCVTITWPQAHRVPHGSNSPEQALKQHKGLRTAPLSRTLGRSMLARFLQPT